MPTAHIGAQENAFAKVVLMPGDPLRAKFIADNFLHDVEQVTSIRGILGFTGYTESGKRISVMASGMGMPSIGIYSHELYSHYGVETIIRVGTLGGYQSYTKVGDLVVAMVATTDSNWATQYGLHGVYSAAADYWLVKESEEIATKLGFRVHVGAVRSSDIFYDIDPDAWKKWAKLGIIGVEMESFALYMTAARFNKNALCICTVSNSFVDDTELSAEERQTNLVNMIKTAVAIAEKHA